MLLSSVPPVAASLIATTGNILHIAPASRGWKARAPDNVVFLPPTIGKQALLIQIGLLRPSMMIVGGQAIDADVIEQWRISHPFGDLHLIRRGNSLDNVRLNLCESKGIRVGNTPGVEASHVAVYIAHWLKRADGSLPPDICVLGYGNVGKELVKRLLDRDPEVRVKVVDRHGRSAGNINRRVSFVEDWSEALEGACAVALCLSLKGDAAYRIERALIQRMDKVARLVCVSKPDIFSDDALQTLAIAEHTQLVLDCAPGALDAFRMRTQALGCSVSTWRKPATLTTHAATTEACQCDLDCAVSVQLSLKALHGIVRRKRAQSLMIPAQHAFADAPCVSIIGRGINGLLQALMFRLANYRVTVYEGSQANDGVGRGAVMTTANAQHDDYLLLANPYLTGKFNGVGIELFEKLLADNPSIDASADGLESSCFLAGITSLLLRSGVEFTPKHLGLVQIAELSREQFVITAQGGGALDGISIVHCAASNLIVDGATYSECITLGLIWACLVQEIIQAKAAASSALYQ
ncbi:amino acid dehydrogenase [Pseudomonas lurida]|jgi:hypothetical protein|uniref:NAD(P)-dependent oxidoreductase n=1 Tax=Pseudomonas TaxID=286 RepID=UPI000CF6F8B1|nr:MULTISPECIES: NAD(P)-dependent oxidoreductase [Pseudomonas]AVJ39450.1 amino acid dehydrogenase [Pseudomonas lurida]MBC3240406.1 amino acid dehydrogenase [Pseudomonas lurida]MBC3923741.1 amino acid dehydrogenase [Pseudomonas lurida]PRA17329.1 amino acid dehydrogenase [Pseudomonas sp. MYb13]PRA23505.1 amino acid dehydrogenase [Pseudomonas lurida]